MGEQGRPPSGSFWKPWLVVSWEGPLTFQTVPPADPSQDLSKALGTVFKKLQWPKIIRDNILGYRVIIWSILRN